MGVRILNQTCFSVETSRFMFMRSHLPQQPIPQFACAFVKSVIHAGFSFTGIIASTDIDDSVCLATELFPAKHQKKIMGPPRITSWRWLAIGLLGLLSTGCIPALPLRHLSVQDPLYDSRPRLEFAKAAEAILTPNPSPNGRVEARADQATLDELLDIAVKHHPDLTAARARVEVARGRMIQAGLYPNPSIGPNWSQLGDSANRTGEAGARLTQTFVTKGKLRLAKEAGARGVEAADFQAITKWHEVVTRVRFAYFDLLTAQREQETLKGIVKVSEEAFDVLKKKEKLGAGNRPDLLRAKVELEQNQLKQKISQRRVDAAAENLLTALGRPPIALDHLKTTRKELDETPPDYDWTAMLECLRETSTELHEARALIAQQEKLLTKAKADVFPNITVALIPFYESFAREMRGEFVVQAPIPIFDRNQGNIHAAQADVTRSIAFQRQLELQLTERLTNAFQRYQSARHQTESYERTIVKEAKESLKLVKAIYDSGGDTKYDYSSVLLAQQVLFQAQLAQTQALGEMWRSVVEIAGSLQQDRLLSGCAVKERR
jgi:cobalt-zinc-cadmium efflux system outer membrane protein